MLPYTGSLPSMHALFPGFGMRQGSMLLRVTGSHTYSACMYHFTYGIDYNRSMQNDKHNDMWCISKH